MMSADALHQVVLNALEDIKAIDTTSIVVRDVTSITDYMVITSGRSSRHVKAIADQLIDAAKKNGVKPLGMEGEQTSEWILVDLGDVIIHVMQPTTREYYQLEKLWSVPATTENSA